MAWIGRGSPQPFWLSPFLSRSGRVSALSTIGMLLMAIGRVRVESARLRLLVVAGVPFWLAHDVIAAPRARKFPQSPMRLLVKRQVGSRLAKLAITPG